MKFVIFKFSFIFGIVLQLEKPAELNAYVQPAVMPTSLAPIPGGTVCIVSGWGVTQVYSYYLSPVLRAVDVQIIPQCQYYYYYRITDNMVCAGSPLGGKDSCQVNPSSRGFLSEREDNVHTKYIFAKTNTV